MRRPLFLLLSAALLTLVGCTEAPPPAPPELLTWSGKLADVATEARSCKELGDQLNALIDSDLRDHPALHRELYLAGTDTGLRFREEDEATLAANLQTFSGPVTRCRTHKDVRTALQALDDARDTGTLAATPPEVATPPSPAGTNTPRRRSNTNTGGATPRTLVNPPSGAAKPRVTPPAAKTPPAEAAPDRAQPEAKPTGTQPAPAPAKAVQPTPAPTGKEKGAKTP